MEIIKGCLETRFNKVYIHSNKTEQGNNNDTSPISLHYADNYINYYMQLLCHCYLYCTAIQGQCHCYIRHQLSFTTVYTNFIEFIVFKASVTLPIFFRELLLIYLCNCSFIIMAFTYKKILCNLMDNYEPGQGSLCYYLFL